MYQLFLPVGLCITVSTSRSMYHCFYQSVYVSTISTSWSMYQLFLYKGSDVSIIKQQPKAVPRPRQPRTLKQPGIAFAPYTYGVL